MPLSTFLLACPQDGHSKLGRMCKKLHTLWKVINNPLHGAQLGEISHLRGFQELSPLEPHPHLPDPLPGHAGIPRGGGCSQGQAQLSLIYVGFFHFGFLIRLSVERMWFPPREGPLRDV